MNVIEKLESLISSLQMLLTFLKKHPTLARHVYLYKQNVNIHFYNKEGRKDFSNACRSLASGVGKLPKEYTDYSCKVSRQFGEMVFLNVSITRDAVCERIVKETKEIPGYYVDAHVEEVIEWKCK